MSLARTLSEEIVLEEQSVGPVGSIFDEELAIVRNAIGKRRREFACGRQCAHRALQRMGMSAAAILSGPDRAPVWPSGIVGSITHCDGYCAAALARATEIASVGIDAELITPLDLQVLEIMASPEERRDLQKLPAELPSLWPCTLFSAKEAIFKCWYPLTKHWLNFHDAKLSIDPSTCSFEAELLVLSPNFPRKVRGRFHHSLTHVFTAIEIAAR